MIRPVLADVRKIGMHLDELVVQVDQASRQGRLAACIENVLRAQRVCASENRIVGDSLVVDATGELSLVEKGRPP